MKILLPPPVRSKKRCFCERPRRAGAATRTTDSIARPNVNSESTVWAAGCQRSHPNVSIGHSKRSLAINSRLSQRKVMATNTIDRYRRWFDYERDAHAKVL